MLQNADCFESDAVIIDLEDTVHVNEKDNARNLVHYYLESLTDVPMEIVFVSMRRTHLITKMI